MSQRLWLKSKMYDQMLLDLSHLMEYDTTKQSLNPTKRHVYAHLIFFSDILIYFLSNRWDQN